ncbi:L-aspartate oxidase [Arthrobacter sp. B0490]|uniref:L-aspartate oxidase n=1 Tax=Arthrobacter sp. B0490 TaxID=2058891 RepID=UPI000CE56794|nr:L-aspartate oxidase [Arthrobacter sp. B0490]
MTPGRPGPVRQGTDRPVRRSAVVGAGVAGLQTALVLRRLDPHHEVLLLCKAALAESNTRYAQGGIAAVVPRRSGDRPAGTAGDPAGDPAEDSVEAHIADTLAAGAGLADPHAVAVLCRGAADGVRALERAGVVFDTGDTGNSGDSSARASLARGREAAHSAARILHIGGDATGAGLVAALVAAVRADEGIRVLEDTLVTRVLLDGPPGSTRGGAPRATGVEALSGGRKRQIEADAVVLATGGAGQLFEHTTNPVISTGDGVALAWRAGAVVADLEFFQFHPTSLDVPGNPLISEAVRGEGARLVDDTGRAFMTDHHPDGDLAPRDVVARAIASRLAPRLTSQLTDRTTGRGPRVRLDATALGAAFLARRFPSLTALTARHGLDWSADPVPVVPAAHYWMGGVRTDTEGRTSVPGLFAVGEVACTGVHGANRLASNSLLEGVVFGTRCAQAITAGGGAVPRFDAEALELDADGTPTQSFRRRDLQVLMSDHAGILRTQDGLDLARKHLASYHPGTDPEEANLLLCARLLVHAAADRERSSGAHFREDRAQAAPGHPVPSRSYVRATRGATP